MKKPIALILTFVFTFMISCGIVPAGTLSPSGITAPAENTEEIIPATETPPAVDVESEYRKITREEALELMSGGVLLVDARPYREYEKGHMENAVSLPYDKNGHYIETFIADKNITILVYCQDGKKSVVLVKKLIGLGYTGVFDIGGYDEWLAKDEKIKEDRPAKITQKDVPEDTVEPIDFSVTMRIHEDLPEFTFRLEGTCEIEYSLNYNRNGYTSSETTRISKLTITDEDGGFYQEFAGLDTETRWTHTIYGLSFEDYNFDGYLDIELRRHMGGTMLNFPNYYWLWDVSEEKFVMNEQLMEISDGSMVYVDEESKQLIESFVRLSNGYTTTCHYEYEDGFYVRVKIREDRFERDELTDEIYWHVTVSELIDGEMRVVEDYYVEDED